MRTMFHELALSIIEALGACAIITFISAIYAYNMDSSFYRAIIDLIRRLI